MSSLLSNEYSNSDKSLIRDKIFNLFSYITSPVSSNTSLQAACSSVSPASTAPQNGDQKPPNGTLKCLYGQNSILLAKITSSLKVRITPTLFADLKFEVVMFALE